MTREDCILAIGKALLRTMNARRAYAMSPIWEWDELSTAWRDAFLEDAEAALDATDPWIVEQTRAAFYEGVSSVTDAQNEDTV